MPELEWAYGYPAAMLLMIGAAVPPYFVFKWMKWFPGLRRSMHNSHSGKGNVFKLKHYRMPVISTCGDLACRDCGRFFSA
jgi:hypothetical protein